MKQPEALFLADWLEHRTNIMMQDQQAAAELRRLHALNQELLEALKQIEAIEELLYGGDWEEIEQAKEIARAAITKAEEQK